MKTINLEQFGTTELTLDEKRSVNGGNPFLLAMLIWGLGYMIGRWIGGDPVY